ncbi:MAG TPA: carboxypeptidase-like regulatory domain-containing protein [Candidatus Solibacter sp.]|nr:carboxypeptidase-like regulatory domain-containing protein [Candidatus Solibacter sp.]
MSGKALALGLAFLSVAAAQEFRATLTGRITDPSGAPVVNVSVQVRNSGTNELAVAATDPQGNYAVPFLRPGTYSFSAEAAGFKRATREGLVLNVNQTATLNIQLELGAVAEQVTVTAEIPLLEESSGDRGDVVDEQAVKEYPLNGRNPFMLSMLIAGVNFNGSLAYQRPFDNGAIADWSINGSRNRQNEFLLDGAPNNAQAGGNNLAYVPPVDAVLEFKIQTNSYDAQYGRTGGGIINVLLKSGTNRVHGALYEFARRNAWDANSFQNNARGAPKEGHFLDQYGVQVDGPLYIAKLYNGRNRTFFLFNYEGYHEGTPQPLILSVPEPEMRNGDFSNLVDPRGRAITVYDAASGRNVSGTWTRDAFPGNVIPKDRLNPIARRIVDYFPLPNTRTDGAEYSQQNFFISGGVNTARDDFYNLVFKFDQNIGDRHHVFFRHGSNDRSEQRTFNGILKGPGQDGQHPLKRVNDAYVIDWVGTLSPTLIVNARASFSRYVEGSRADDDRGFDLTTLGFPASLASQLPYGAFFGRYTIDGYIALGRYPNQNVTNTFSVHPSVARVQGSRTTKTGIDMRWIQYSTQNPGNVFTLGASKSFTQRDYRRGDDLSGSSLATWLLGTPTSGSINYADYPIFLYRYFAPWVQHDWKAKPKLTLNFGLRWDLNMPPNERFNRLNRGFDPKANNPVDQIIDREKFPDFPALRGGLRFAGVDGAPRSAADLYLKTLQPRAGFAYALTRRTVLRGGWGRYFLNPNNDYLQTIGFSVSTPLVSSSDGSRTGIENRINDPFPTVLRPQGSALGPLTFLGRGFNFVNSSFEIPYVDQFSFGVQRALTSRSRLDVAYSANRGRRQQNSKVFNEDEVEFRDRCNFMLGGNPVYCDAQVPNPFRGLAPFEGTSQYTNTTFARSQLLRPFPQFGGITELMRNDGASWYNSLQTTFQIRGRGVNLNANYTFAKLMERTGFNDPLRNVMQQSVYSWDRPHRFVVSTIYPLPLGRGKHWLGNARGLAAHLASGWQGSVIFQWTSGRPWDLPGNVLYLKDARIPGFDWNATKVQAIQPCVSRWNEDNTVTMLPFGTEYGCTEPNFLVVPRFNPRYTPYRDARLRLQATRLADVSLNKMTRLTEKLNLQFRAEVFNLTNSFFMVQQHFNSNPESPNFGSIIKAAVSSPNSNYPRYVQLGAKLIW